MRSTVRWQALAVLVLCGACSAGEPVAKAAPAFVADVPLPGDSSRFDYESLDPGRHLLFIAHLGAGEVLVFDTEARRVVARIPKVQGVHGVLVVPALHRVYASATGTDEVVVIDEDSFKITARIPGGRYPDGMAFAPDVGKLYVSDETGGTETVIDTATNRRLATIDLGGEAGNSQYDGSSRHVFVNVQTRAELVEIDPEADRVLARIPLPGAEGNHGLLIEPERRRAFIACEDNDKLMVLDLRSRKPIAEFSVGRGPDVLARDAGLGRVFVASESGTLSAFDSDDAGVRRAFEGFAGPNAHVVAIESAAHLAYLPLKNLDGRPALRILGTGGR